MNAIKTWRWLIVPAILTCGALRATADSSVTQRGQVLEFTVGKDRVLVQVCASDILRVDYRPNGVISPRTPTIDQLACVKADARIDASADPVVLETDRMRVRLDRATFALEVRDAQGKLLLRDPGLKSWKTRTLNLEHAPEDRLYGIRIKAGGLTRPQGGAVAAGAQGDGGGPFIWSTAGYGVLIDSDGGEFANEGGALRFSRSANGAGLYALPPRVNLEYFVIVGHPAQIISGATLLTGRPPMLPKWAMGFTNSEWGIDQPELLQIVDTYRAKGLPIDNYTLDFDWKAWGEDEYGEFRWNPTKFPDGPSGKLKTVLEAKGVKLTGIMKPRIHVDTVQGREATSRGFWLSKAAFGIDYFSKQKVGVLNFALPEARDWYWQHTKPALEAGMVGWWNDEADENQGNFQFLNMQRALYEGQRRDSSLRVWSLNRNFYLGSQRYAYGMWSGDIPTGFVSMGFQREQMLSAVNLGQAHWSMDTGGFNGDPSPENYARWMQFAAFTPIFRVHGTLNAQRQPWVFGPPAEAVAKRALELRYRLMPYIYAAERRAFETGVGIVRPLLFDFPDDPKLADESGAWMFGDGLLVAPVIAQGTSQKKITLPPGTWTDYFKGTTYQGGRTITYPVDPATWADIPLFVRQGAIIPTQDVMNFVGEKPIRRVFVDVFPDRAASSFTYYDDDGMSYNYERGEFFKQLITVQANDAGISLKLSAREGTFAPVLEHYVFRIHGLGGTGVTINGAALTRFSSLEELEGSNTGGWATGRDVYGEVTYVSLSASIPQAIQISR